MTEQQAIEALHALPRLPGGPNTLDRMRALLARLGNPEQNLKFIHIAGTNGKGSLAALTASILSSADYKTGLTISPFVTGFRERFQIDGRQIPARTLTALVQQVLAAGEELRRQTGTGPVEFDAVTAVALLWFAREHCDLVVLETGLGGRFDATNAVPNKLIAAITKIGMDHTELLGDTLPKIAAEKAGIICPGCTVVCYPEQPEEAMGPILSAAAENKVSIVTPDLADLKRLKCRSLENLIDYGGYRVRLPFPGRHQANHAAMAVEIALTLWREYGYEIPDEAILNGLANARQPARIEVLRRHPLLLLDGCHNPDGGKALADTLAEAGYEENLVFVLGVMADKDYEGLLGALEPLAARAYTVTPDHPRALPAADLQKAARFHFDAEAAESVPAAIRAAVRWADHHNLPGVVVCGSLFLAAQARPILLKEAEK